ncbi:MAG: ABC transporter permease [Christensenellales bacterium]|jgi:ribose transport system permease protein
MKKRGIKIDKQNKGVITIFTLLSVVFIIMCFYSSSFRSFYNITNLLVQCVPLACVAIGQTFVIVSGGIDLSVGSTISICTAIASKLLNTDSVFEAFIGSMLILIMGIFIGLINGVGINFLNVPPLITTLCSSTILSGLALYILPIAGGRINKDFARFIFRKWTIISMPLIILLIIFLIMRTILYKTSIGTGFYAIGKNRQIAKSMGVNVRRTGIIAYVIAGFCAAITGLLLACRMRVGDPTCGVPFTMDSITASVIGGTSMSGGVGLLSGTIAGAFLIGMLSNVMNNLAVNQFYQYVLKGGLLIVAMIVYSISGQIERKRNERSN